MNARLSFFCHASYILFASSAGLCLLAALSSARAEAEEELPAVTTTTVDSGLRMVLTPEYDSITKAGTNLSSVGFGAGVQYGFADRWGLGISLRQAFSTSGFTSTFTAFDLKLAFAITGSLLRRTETVRLGDSSVVTNQSFSKGGFRAEASLSQYYFNGSVGVFPLTGAGISAYYEFPSRTFMSFELGARVDDLSNGTLGFTPIQGFAGILFWL